MSPFGFALVCMRDKLVCVQEMYHHANLLCEAASAPVHWALLSSDAHESDSQMYHTLTVTLWAVHCTIHQQLVLSQQQQVQFLASNNIKASVSVSAQHALLRPAKRRKSHKHKRRKSQKRQRQSLEEECVPSSGEDSMSDGDLGIMTSDSDRQMPRNIAVWQLQMAGPRPVTVSATVLELPDVLLWHVILHWLDTLDMSGLTS